MGKKDLGFDVVYRGDTRKWIAPGIYVFFQRLKEHGGGYWFGFLINEPISLRQGMGYLMTVRSQEKDIMKFDDRMDTFMLRGSEWGEVELCHCHLTVRMVSGEIYRNVTV